VERLRMLFPQTAERITRPANTLAFSLLLFQQPILVAEHLHQQDLQ
jgi:hypothetical protein